MGGGGLGAEFPLLLPPWLVPLALLSGGFFLVATHGRSRSVILS